MTDVATDPNTPAPTPAAEPTPAPETPAAEPPRIDLGASDDNQADLADQLMADHDSELGNEGDTVAPESTEPAPEATPAEPTEAPAATPSEPAAPEVEPQPVAVPETPTPTPPQEMPAPQTPPAEVPVAPQAPTPTPPVTPTPETPQPAQPPQAEAPTPPQPTAEEQLAQRQEWRANMQEQLASSHFKVPEGLVEELNMDPSKAIPKLMAQVYLDAVEGAANVIQQHLPALVQNVLQQNTVQQQREADFAARWPQINLSDEAHRSTVLRFGAAYRQAVPNATEEEFVRDVGAQTLVALQLPTTVAPAAPNGNGAEPAPVATPPAAPPPHQPVGSGAPSAAPGVVAPTNVFDQLTTDSEALEENLDLDA